jgi:hypothetical protein
MLPFLILFYYYLVFIHYGINSSFVNPLPIDAVLLPPYGFALAVAVNTDVGIVKLPV